MLLWVLCGFGVVWDFGMLVWFLCGNWEIFYLVVDGNMVEWFVLGRWGVEVDDEWMGEVGFVYSSEEVGE